MSNPLPPAPGFQPPASPYAPQKRAPSCWAIGGIGCLVIFILGAILTFLAIDKAVHTKAGHQLMQGFNSALKSGTAGAACVDPMIQIQKAILRYHEHEGKYPDNLNQLKAKYLPPGVTLHCGVDDNDDPDHVTYAYIKPTEKTPGSAVLLRYSWSVTIAVLNQSQTQTTTEQITLDGKVSTSNASTASTMSPAAATPSSTPSAPGHSGTSP